MFANSEDEDSFFEGGAQGGIFSLAQLEKQAAKDTGNMLAELEHRLYDAPIILTPPPQELSMSIGHNADNSEMRVDQGIWPTHEFRRFADNEYNAHTDTMENHELQQWQQTFPYLRVVGQGLKGLDAGSLHNEAQTEITIKPLLLDNNNKSDIPSTEDGICVGFQIEPKSPTTSPTPSSQTSPRARPYSVAADFKTRSEVNLAIDSAPNQPVRYEQGLDASDGPSVQGLCIVGHACLQPTIEGCMDVEEVGDDDELPIVHGVLEEVVEVNNEDILAPWRGIAADNMEQAAEADGVPIEPNASKRAEVVSILTDALWPDVVQALRPLVRRVVEASRPLGPDLYADLEPARCGSGSKGVLSQNNFDVETDDW